MFVRYLKSEEGMGFADLLAATVIVIIALSTMFLIILSSQIRVTQDYHYRKALLGALSRLETIKCYNKDFKNNLITNVPGVEDPILLDENYKNPLMGRVTLNVHTNHSLLDVSPYAGRYEVTIKVEWEEKSSSILNYFHPKTQMVLLREDYYFQSSQGNG